MPEATVKVTIPDESELACDCIRPAKKGEHYLYDSESYVIQVMDNDPTPRVILRPAFKWPAWLKAAAIARDADGTWWAYSIVPTQERLGWRVDDSEDTQRIAESFWDIDLPSDDIPWQETLRVNPACMAKGDNDGST